MTAADDNDERIITDISNKSTFSFADMWGAYQELNGCIRCVGFAADIANTRAMSLREGVVAVQIGVLRDDMGQNGDNIRAMERDIERRKIDNDRLNQVIIDSDSEIRGLKSKIERLERDVEVRMQAVDALTNIGEDRQAISRRLKELELVTSPDMATRRLIWWLRMGGELPTDSEGVKA